MEKKLKKYAKKFNKQTKRRKAVDREMIEIKERLSALEVTVFGAENVTDYISKPSFWERIKNLFKRKKK